MNLRQQLEAKLKEWQAALDSKNMESAKALQLEANQLRDLISSQKELEAAKAIAADVPDPVRPVLPGTTTTETATETSVKAADIDKSGLEPSYRAAYVTKFGTAEDMVKAVLTDLHGPSYEQQWFAQKEAFRRYLRSGDKNMDQRDVALLHQVVMNPASVKAALADGYDSIRALKSTMVEAVDTLGGYVVPVDFQMKIIERMKGLTVMRGRASVNSTSRDRVEMPEITGGNSQYTTGVRGKWVDETPTAGVAETNFTFGMRGISIYTYMAETPLSRNLVEDSAFDIEGYLSKKFAETTAIDEDNAFLTGDGVGKPQGILPGGANGLSITSKKSGSASALTWNGLISMTYALDAQYRQNGAVWIAAKSTYEAIAKLVENNQYLWSAYQYEGGEGGRPPRLLGYETLEQETMPAIAAGTFPIIFGNPSGYYIYDRVGMTVERFLDASTARQNLVYYVMRRRVGGQPIEKWQFAVQEVGS